MSESQATGQEVNGPRRRTNAPSDDSPARSLEESLEDTTSSGKDSLSWQEKAKAFQGRLRKKSLESFAEKLGVSVESLKRLGIGFDRYAFTFPMVTAEGEVCGIRTRPLEGGKGTMPGGHLGLFIPEGVTPANVKVICEGETDTAAALTLRVEAIGTPGVGTAIGEAVAFIEQCPIARPCIIADNDPSGQSGAGNLASALNAVGIPCRILTPPSPHNDLREWKCNGGLTKEKLLKAIDESPMHWPESKSLPPGFVQVPSWLLRKGIAKVVGHGPFALVCLLRSYHGGNGQIHPSRKALADGLGVSVATIDRWKTILKAHGLIDWKRGRPGWACEYRVDLGPWKGQKKR